MNHGELLLQWGRDLKIAEITTANGVRLVNVPLQWGRDLKIAEMARGRYVVGVPAGGFNGAAI